MIVICLFSVNRFAPELMAMLQTSPFPQTKNNASVGHADKAGSRYAVACAPVGCFSLSPCTGNLQTAGIRLFSGWG